MLTAAKVEGAKPREKPYKLLDREGLYLRITPQGSRTWRLRYWLQGREGMMSLGAYPVVTLAMARDAAMEARRLVARGIDPVQARRAQRADSEHTFAAVAEEWLKRKRYAPKTYAKSERVLLKGPVRRALGTRPVAAITSGEVLRILHELEDRGRYETARVTRQKVGQVLRHAVRTGRAAHDVTAELRGALEPKQVRHHSAILDPARVGALLRDVDGYVGQLSTTYALRLLPYLFVRTFELRLAEWAQFDLASGWWRLPGNRRARGKQAAVKMDEMHMVPLAPQVVALLQELRRITGRGRLLFPGLRTAERPISDNTLNAALRRLGYSGEDHTGHGFRTLASTHLNELGWPPDLIELQLAHAERDEVRNAYNRAQRLDERRLMMCVWASYLDGLKAEEADVAAVRAAARASIHLWTSSSSQPTAPPREPG